MDYDNRAAEFDVQNRYIPLDFAANDVALSLAYVSSHLTTPESYRLDVKASDLNLTRGSAAHPVASPVHGEMQATIDLTRNAAYLRSLRFTARARGTTDHILFYFWRTLRLRPTTMAGECEG